MISVNHSVNEQIENQPDYHFNLGSQRMFLIRALVGLAAGLLIGPLTMTLVQLYWEADTGLQAADIGAIIMVGGLFGAPVGAIMALASGMVEYRSGLGIEWGLVGALAAVLAAVGLGTWSRGQRRLCCFSLR
jgi:hypothetical protein